MIITHHKEKLFNSIIYFVKNTKRCNKTKLMKLLYYLDFWHFKETGASVTGLDYYAWDFGPYPVEFGSTMSKNKELKEYINISKNDLFTEIYPKKEFDSKYFTKRELRILKDVAYIFITANAKQMVDCTHLPNQPWETTLKEKGEKAKIDYFLACDEFSLSKEDIIENINDKEQIKRVFK